MSESNSIPKGGFFRCYRGWYSDPAFRSPLDVSVFLYIYQKANWHEDDYTHTAQITMGEKTRYKTFLLKRGEAFITRNEIAKGFDLHPSTVTRQMQFLQNVGKIRYETFNFGIRVEIVDYQAQQEFRGDVNFQPEGDQGKSERRPKGDRKETDTPIKEEETNKKEDIKNNILGGDDFLPKVRKPKLGVDKRDGSHLEKPDEILWQSQYSEKLYLTRKGCWQLTNLPKNFPEFQGDLDQFRMAVKSFDEQLGVAIAEGKKKADASHWPHLRKYLRSWANNLTEKRQRQEQFAKERTNRERYAI